MGVVCIGEPVAYTADRLALSEEEELLVEQVVSLLRSCDPLEAELVERRFQDLHALGEAISRFPSVREAQVLRGVLRDGDTLAASLKDFSRSGRLLHTPTRIVAARSYLVAKTHAFSLLSLAGCGLAEIQARIRSVVFSIACSLMAEDVYLSCLEDPLFSEERKALLAADLVRLWDSGSDPRSSEHVPALQALWAARDAAPPVFGTMDGSCEMIRISLDMGDDWQDFLLDKLKDEEIKSALEEFLFGLSYEEIRTVRSRLARFGIPSVGHEEVRSYLGDSPSYVAGGHGDPRYIYDFYSERRDLAQGRRRMSASGPKRPLEELYLMYRLIQD